MNFFKVIILPNFYLLVKKNGTFVLENDKNPNYSRKKLGCKWRRGRDSNPRKDITPLTV